MLGVEDIGGGFVRNGVVNYFVVFFVFGWLFM